MKKQRTKRIFLDALRKNPIVSAAASHASLSRQTVYRWKGEDPAFAREMEEAMNEGDELMNDMAESQHYKRIRDGDYSAVKFQLQMRHPKFRQHQARKQTRAEKLREEKQREREVFERYISTPQKRELDQESIRRLKAKGLLLD